MSVASDVTSHAQLERYEPDAWDRLFAAPAVTVIGASPNVPPSVELVRNLRRMEAPYGGRINLVNPRRPEVAGVPCLRSVEEVDGSLGIVFFFTPAATTLDILDTLPSRPDGVVVYAGGFKEVGNVEGEHRLASWAAAEGVPLFGPQSIGLAVPARGLLATSLPMPEAFVAGPVGLLSSSGGILVAVLRSILQRGLGLGCAASWGNGAALSFGDLALAFLRQTEVQILAVYLESVENVEELAAVGRAAERCGKPVVILPGGTSDIGSRAGTSHTGALATRWNVVGGVAEQYGMLLVADPVELLWAVEALVEAQFQRTESGGVGIFSVSAGSAITIADAADEAGVPLPDLEPKTAHALGVEPEDTNPFDIGARVMVEPDAYREKLRAFVADSGIGIIARVAGVGLPDEAYPLHVSTGSIFVEEVAAAGKIPVLCAPAWQDREKALSWPGTVRAAGAPEVATKLSILSRWCSPPATGRRSATANRIASPTQPADVTVVSGVEAQSALRSLPIIWPRQLIAHTVEDATAAAVEIGFPVVLKSERGLAHRADAGLVLTGINDPTTAQTAAAYLLARAGPPLSVNQEIAHQGEELVLGLESAGVFGQLLMFGRGGRSVGADVRFRLIPLEPPHRKELLAAYIGERPHQPLEQLLMAAEKWFRANARVLTLEFNPLVVTATGEPIALDAKIHLSRTPENGGPKEL